MFHASHPGSLIYTHSSSTASCPILSHCTPLQDIVHSRLQPASPLSFRCEDHSEYLGLRAVTPANLTAAAIPIGKQFSLDGKFPFSDMGRALLFDTAARWWSKSTVAVVTGSNKGLGEAIVLTLARNGVTVVSTARDPARGLAAVARAVEAEPELKGFLHFHQLDVTAAQSVAKLASYLRETFGGIDILINNAAIQFASEEYEDAVDTIETNYFGVRRVTEKLLPLLRASPFGARIIMVSSQVGQMENFDHNEYLKTKIAEAIERKDEKVVDALASKYLNDVKAGRAKEENWGKNLFQYRESKLLMSIYTRVLAAQLSDRPEGHMVYVNAICPGAMKSDLLQAFRVKVGPAKAEELTATVKWRPVTEAGVACASLALLPVENCSHGKFFVKDLEERAW